ncbi:MAG: FIST signal transduction protein, partial [Thermomicrobiales bacterium]
MTTPKSDPQPAAAAFLATGIDWRHGLEPALAELDRLRPDALILFATYHHAGQAAEMLRTIRQSTGAAVVVGCTGVGVVGDGREIERSPAVSILGLRLPGATLSTVRVTGGMADADADAAAWQAAIGVDPDAVNGWLLFLDPFTVDTESTLEGFHKAYPRAPVVGGMASPGPHDRRTWIFADGEAFEDGGVALAIGGAYNLVPMVSQGCEPLGEPWTITGAQSHWVESISSRPAVQVLVETLSALPEDERLRAQRNLLVGLAADEYRHDFLRGDFLIRNVVGLDQNSGSLGIGATPRVGQTIQFQQRDAATADLDLTLMLEHVKARLDLRRPIAGILCTCNGRGAGLFGTSHHDARAVTRT